uniref:type IV secretion system protein n=1 Tax=Klebsiella pneumoniae TaxID=573 RepID=UPI003D3036BD
MGIPNDRGPFLGPGTALNRHGGAPGGHRRLDVAAVRSGIGAVGLGPLFILCLLFDQTKQLFQRWLFYGIGTMFSMA